MKVIAPAAIKILLNLFFLVPFALAAQNNNAPSSLEEHELKITGYLQTQYQKAASQGIVSFSGGDFGEHSSERFMIRRGRLKIDRVDKYTNIVFQIDATQNGVQLMDAFIQLHAAGKAAFTLTAGLFNRPFGHSISYSSGYRDFPERARVFQTLMPRERDLGAMLSYHPKKIARFLTADLAIVNGSGLNGRDYDSKKDIIGNLSFKFDSLASNRLSVGLGGSIYRGTVRSDNPVVFIAQKNRFDADNAPLNVDKNVKRNYLGANFQLSYAHPLGTTTFKAEYTAGIQPGIAGSLSVKGPVASTSFGTQPTGSLYLRHFKGYYYWFSQQIGATGLTALLAYDVYDPNKYVKGTGIGSAGSETTSGDIRYETIGYGGTYQLSKQIKFTLYNEHVKNESTLLPGYLNDIKDNVFTARLQYRW